MTEYWTTMVKDSQIALGGGTKPDRLEAFAFDALAFHFPGPAHGFSRFARPPLGRLLIMTPELHLPEHAFALHFFLERLQRLIDIVVTNENLHFDVVSLLSDMDGQRQMVRRRTTPSGAV